MYCKYCGQIIDDDSKFCRFCGKSFENEIISKDTLSNKESNSNRINKTQNKNKTTLANEIFINFKFLIISIILSTVCGIGYSIYHSKDIAPLSETPYFQGCYDACLINPTDDFIMAHRKCSFVTGRKKFILWSGIISLSVLIIGRYTIKGSQWVADNKSL